MHTACRPEYIKEKNIARDLTKVETSKQNQCTILWDLEKFDFKRNCLFCSEKFDILAEKKACTKMPSNLQGSNFDSER